MSKKIKFLLLTAMCLIFSTTMAFAATPGQALDSVMRMHGTITEINDDMITIQDTQSNQSVALMAMNSLHTTAQYLHAVFHHKAKRMLS